MKQSASFNWMSCGRKFIWEIWYKAIVQLSTKDYESLWLQQNPSSKNVLPIRSREKNFISTKFHEPSDEFWKADPTRITTLRNFAITKIFIYLQNPSELSNNYFKDFNRNLCSNLRKFTTPRLPGKLEEAWENPNQQRVINFVEWNHFLTYQFKAFYQRKFFQRKFKSTASFFLRFPRSQLFLQTNHYNSISHNLETD